MNKIHVVNDKGDRKEVSWNELLKLNEDHNSHKYYHDVDWYLKNGYHLIDDVIKEFEYKLKNDNNK